MAECLANLTTAADPDYIEVDGKRYDLAQIERMSLTEQIRVEHLSERTGVLSKRAYDDGEELTDDEAREYEQVVDQLFAHVVPKMPKSVSKRLAIWKKMQIVNVFFTRQLAAVGAPRAQTTNGSQEPSADGSTPSPGSSASTEAAPGTG